MAEPSITDWISAISTAVAAIAAVYGVWKANDKFLSKELDEERHPLDPIAPEEIAEGQKPKQYVVFSTSSQTTSLLLTGSGLECHLQGAIGKRTDGLQWRLEEDELSKILKEKDFSATSGYRARTGHFSIGRHKNWLYSKKLYPSSEYLESDIQEILKRVTSLPAE